MIEVKIHIILIINSYPTLIKKDILQCEICSNSRIYINMDNKHKWAMLYQFFQIPKLTNKINKQINNQLFKLANSVISVKQHNQ